MNYDPIHDTIVGKNEAKPMSSPVKQEQQQEQHQPTTTSTSTNVSNVAKNTPDAREMNPQKAPQNPIQNIPPNPTQNVRQSTLPGFQNMPYSPSQDANSIRSATNVPLMATPLTTSILNAVDVQQSSPPTKPPSSMAHLMSNDSEDHMDLDQHELMSSPARESPAHESEKKKKPVATAMPKGVRYLKKSDGEPFWRKDIQYDFLEALFEDDHAVFTNPFPYCSVPGFSNEPKYTFAELYVRTLAESSKCSKILRERLLKDFDMGKSVAKVCLLVNTGRMNTTVNFVPEMRSTLRTYHSIPSLQADPQTGGSKQLQDTPRLKSILKAVSDKTEDFKSIKDLLENPPEKKPNTNLVLLLFVLSSNVHGVKFHHEHTPECYHTSNSFMEFFLETSIRPANRAHRFLWLMYTYLETNFTPDDLAQNPFNPHEIPPIELISEQEVNNCDQDTDYEIEYSERMFRTRLKYLADEEHNSNPKRGNKSRRERDEEVEEYEEEEDDGGDEDYDDKASKKNKQPSAKKRKKAARVTSYSFAAARGVSVNADTEKLGEEEIDYGPSRFKLQLPLKNIEKVIQMNKHAAINELATKPDSLLNRNHLTSVINKFKQALKNRKLPEPETSDGLDRLCDWLFRYFQFQKSTNIGLLGMEWENIRYDMIHGIEDYLYETEGKDISKLYNPLDKGKDDKEKLKQLLKNQNQYKPFYNYERNSERSQFIYDLLSYCKTVLEPSLEAKINTKTKVSINLDKEEIKFQ